MLTFKEFLLESEKADSWLKKYTYENLDKWPSTEVIQDLLSDYPYTDSKPVYRGINFRDEEQYNKFIEETKDGTILETGGITSWSKHKDEARTFAITRPTYFLNRELMQDVSIKNKNKDFMIGHSGVILEIKIPKDHGIDVTKSEAAHESEVILIPGKYKIRIAEKLIPYQKSITVENYQSMIHDIKSLSDKTSLQKLEHILFRFVNFDDPTKEKLWELLDFKPEIKTRVEIKDSFSRFNEDEIKEIRCGMYLPQYITLLYNFLLPKHQKIILDFINKSLDELKTKLDSEIKKHDIDYKKVEIHVSDITTLAQQLTGRNIFKNINKKLGDEYNKLNSLENVRKINKMSKEDQQKAIKDMTKDIIKLLQNIN